MKKILVSIFTIFSIVSFAQPVCQSQSSSAITSTSANVTYYVNANGKYTTLTIQYNTINTDSALNAGPSQGDGAVQSVFNGVRTGTILGLAIKKTYYWRVVATNTNGTTKSGVLSFTTLGEKPTITLRGAQGRYNFGLIDYDLNTKNDSTTVYIKYGASATNLNNQYNEPNKFFGNLFTTSKIQGLLYNTFYTYRVYATNSLGTDSLEGQFVSSPMPGNPTINSYTILPLINTCKIQANVAGNYGEPGIRVKYGTTIGTLNRIVNGDTLFFGKWDPNPTGTLTANLSGLISSTKYYCQIEIFHNTGLTILLDSFNTISSNVDTSGLLAYYSFENNFNSYNNVHNLASATATTAGFATGKIGQCATFNGLQTLTNTSIASVLNNNEFTIAFWAYRTTNGSYATSYELFGSNFIRNRNSGNREIGMAYTSTLFAIGGSGTEGVNLNAWHHYAFVFKQSGANKFFYNYIDGIFIDSVNVGTGITSLHHFNNVFAVGGGTDAGGTINGLKYFTGKIDEFCIFKRALTEQQVFVIASKTEDSLSISGRVITPLRKPIKNAVFNVTIDNNATQPFDSAFNIKLTAGKNIKIKPTKNNDITKANGVKSVDVILVQRHILNQNKLNSAYKLIAADVNGDKNINSVDVIRMKRLILGLDTTFSKGTGANKIDRLWEFVDSSYVFADTTNPFPFKDSIEFTNLTSNKNNQTFIGIKLGDVNYDWDNTIAKIKPIELMANSEWQIANNNVTIKQQKINIKIQTPNNVSTSAFQATLHFDNTKYQLIEIRNNKLEIEYNAIKTGQINLLWVSKDGEPKALNANDILFEFILQPINKAETSIPKLEIENSFAVDENINEREIVLKQNNIQSPSPSTQQWLSIYPTLVHQDATITIASTTNKTITLNVYDIAGKLVDTKNIQVLIGNNTYNYNCSKLQKGNYFISSSNKNEQMKTEKFCKQ